MPKKKIINPDDSSEIRLDEMKKSIRSSSPLMAAITDEEVEAYEKQLAAEASGTPPAAPPQEEDVQGDKEGDEPRSTPASGLLARKRQLAEDQIEAWNNMADQMIRVVRTIKINESKLKKTESRIQRLVWFVVGVMVVSVAGNIYVSLENRRRTQAMYFKMTQGQSLLFDSVARVAEAQALFLKALEDDDPETRREAKVKALEAREKALAVKEKMAPAHEKFAVKQQRAEAKTEVAEAIAEDRKVPPQEQEEARDEDTEE